VCVCVCVCVCVSVCVCVCVCVCVSAFEHTLKQHLLSYGKQSAVD